MTDTSISTTSGSFHVTRIHSRDYLEGLHFAGSRQRLFKRQLTDEQKRIAFDAACEHERLRDEAKERGKNRAKWVEEVLGSFDATSVLARGEQSQLQKDLAAADAKVHDARRREELIASALGYRWDEATVHHYADDIDMVILTVRMDTLEEIGKRRMSEGEEKAAEKRRQVGLAFGGN